MASRVPAEQTAPLPETRRADAERNVQRIQEAAIRLWADEPNAGVADVATAAGVGRATLYRHFPTRESLLEAIRTQGLVDGEEAVQACRLDEGSATEALARLMAAWLELGDRYRVIVVNPSKPDNLGAREREERLDEDDAEARQARPSGGGVLARHAPGVGSIGPRRAAGRGDQGGRRGQDWPRRGLPAADQVVRRGPAPRVIGRASLQGVAAEGASGVTSAGGGSSPNATIAIHGVTAAPSTTPTIAL